MASRDAPRRPSPTEEHYAVGTLLDGKLRIVRLLGQGGMGAVYEVEHELTRHRRALKLLHPRWLPEVDVVDRFLREASAAGRIGNPHIIETFDAGRLASGEPYLVMEMLSGVTLTERLAGTRGLPIAEVAELVGQACEGVQAAHDAGIVHRDLKPDNLFLVEREGRPFVKILDFGVSKFDPRFTTDRATVGGATMGTPYYMSPEQIRAARDLDARSDVYALGVITWECLVGAHPYPCAELPALVAHVLTEEAPSLRDVGAGLPPALVDLVARAMARDRTHRLPSANALAEGLREIAAAQPILSRVAPGKPDPMADTYIAAHTPDPLGATHAAIEVAGEAAITSGTSGESNAPPPDPGVSAPALVSSAMRLATSDVAPRRRSQVLAALAVMATMVVVGLVVFRGARPEASQSAAGLVPVDSIASTADAIQDRPAVSPGGTASSEGAASASAVAVPLPSGSAPPIASMASSAAVSPRGGASTKRPAAGPATAAPSTAAKSSAPPGVIGGKGEFP